MRKWHPRKLTLSRETLLQLTTDDLAKAKGAGKAGAWSEPPQCDPACTSQTLSCTL